MSDPLPVDPIAQLKQNIAALEEKQRAERIDLSAEVQSFRALLMMLERPAANVNQSGRIDMTSDRVDIGDDMVGRDKVTSASETITANYADTDINATSVVGCFLAQTFSP